MGGGRFRILSYSIYHRSEGSRLYRYFNRIMKEEIKFRLAVTRSNGLCFRFLVYYLLRSTTVEYRLKFSQQILFQKEVLIGVNIEKPTLYRIIFRYVNQNPTTIMADVTLTPDVSVRVTWIDSSSDINADIKNLQLHVYRFYFLGGQEVNVVGGNTKYRGRL